MGAQCAGSGAFRRGGDQVVDRVQPHRSAQRRAEQVHEHKITRCRGRNVHPLELVTVERLHHQEIQRHRPLPPGLGHGPVRVIIPADHVQVRAGDLAAQLPRIRQQVHVAAAQPERLAAAQPGPRHQQHDQPVPRRAAPAQQRDDISVGSPAHRTFGLMQPVPGPDPPSRRAVLPAHGGGQVRVIGDLEQQPHQVARCGALGDRVHDHPAHCGQNRVDPPRRPHRHRPRPGQHRRPRPGIDTRHRRSGVRQPRHEQAKLLRPGLPVLPGPGAPPQEQRDRACVRLRRRFRPVPAEPQMPQKRIRERNDRQFLIQHRPVTPHRTATLP